MAGQPIERLMRMRLRALRVRRIDSISAAQLRPTIKPSHKPPGPRGTTNHSVRAQAEPPGSAVPP